MKQFEDPDIHVSALSLVDEYQSSGNNETPLLPFSRTDDNETQLIIF